ncbi:MAG: hypothetical protein C4530_22825 [Desulfobacteraceae bacterium]|nr:MAG: hypothetical protein C4530_22825 [Desulfobacteraceae bacterium]
MQGCANHPEREARFRCMKYGIDMCGACLRCRDPGLYCKFRSSCTIHFLHREAAKGRQAPAAEEMANGL